VEWIAVISGVAAVTDEDLDFLTDLTNRFWREFSDLCNRYIQEAVNRDPELEAYATMMLGESTSIYGRKTMRPTE
jgi:hypothetical protein